VELLSIEGFNIESSHDGVSEIILAKETLPDLILCASKFLDLDCWDVIHALRRNKSTKKNLLSVFRMIHFVIFQEIC
jgi:DNA-binding response OmpR family regulator